MFSLIDEFIKNIDEGKSSDFQKQILKDYNEYHVPRDAKIENKCLFSKKSNKLDLMPAQKFVSKYFKNNKSSLKGMLLYQSVGSGKTCTSVATASAIEDNIKTILWVTRASLKAVMWKNVIQDSCHLVFKEYPAEELPDDLIQRKKLFNRITKKKWLPPISYSTFSNMLSEKKTNQFKKDMIARNGADDILKNTFIIIDEAHNLFNPIDLSYHERTDFNLIKQSIYKSYRVSGENSCKVLLLTATPINDSPLQLCKLLNLLIANPSERLPDTEKDFIDKYIDLSTYKLRIGAIRDIREKTKKLVSYVDRSKDKNYFAQKIFKPEITYKHDYSNIIFIKDFLNKSKDIKKVQEALCDPEKLVEDLSEVSGMNVDINIKMKLVDKKYSYLKPEFYEAFFTDVNILKPFKDYNNLLNKYKLIIEEDYRKQYQNQIDLIYKKYKHADLLKEKDLEREKRDVKKKFDIKMKKEINLFILKRKESWYIVNNTLKKYKTICNEIVKKEISEKRALYINYLKKFINIKIKSKKKINDCIISASGKRNINDCKRFLLWNEDKIPKKIKFDTPSYDKNYILQNVTKYSPIIINFMNNLLKLDNDDMAETGKLYKHVIYVDKKSYNGLKLILSILQAMNFNLCLEKTKTKRGNSLKISQPDKTSAYNMLCLSSALIWESNLSRSTKYNIMSSFNKRPDNINGDNYRFMLFDGGFKEGVDLFDVKYFHILQTPDYENQLIQVIGRATRFCGQSGLHFLPNIGWKLNIFIYDIIMDFDNDIMSDNLILKKGTDYFLQKTYESLSRDARIMKKLELELIDVIRDNAVDKELFQ